MLYMKWWNNDRMFGFGNLGIAPQIVCGKWQSVFGRPSRNMSSVSSADKVDPVLGKAKLDFMRTLEKQNQERVDKLLRLRRKNALVGSAIGATVLGIYIYSMYAVKQETFLDDFEEPAKITKD